MTIGFLPRVEICCFCVKNLMCATYIIGIIGMIVGITHFKILLPTCSNVFTGSVKIIGILAVCSGIVLLGVSLALMVTTAITQKPVTNLFVISAVTAALLSLVYHIVAAVRFINLGYRCDFNAYKAFISLYIDAEPLKMTRGHELFVNVIISIVQTLAMIYFCVVVNSYGEKFDATSSRNLVANSSKHRSRRISLVRG